MEATPKGQRQHDERWQTEVLDGLARIHEVMHDISDGVQKLVALLERVPPPLQALRTSLYERTLLSVDDLAELLGVTPNTVRGLRASRHAPTVTKVGRRVFFRQEDVDVWLNDRRERAPEAAAPWTGSWLPGRIGSSVARTSERPDHCEGSHSEPLTASPYSGRAICRVCRDAVIVNHDGRLRKHYPKTW